MQRKSKHYLKFLKAFRKQVTFCALQTLNYSVKKFWENQKLMTPLLTINPKTRLSLSKMWPKQIWKKKKIVDTCFRHLVSVTPNKWLKKRFTKQIKTNWISRIYVNKGFKRFPKLSNSPDRNRSVVTNLDKELPFYGYKSETLKVSYNLVEEREIKFFLKNKKWQIKKSHKNLKMFYHLTRTDIRSIFQNIYCASYFADLISFLHTQYLYCSLIQLL